MKPLLGEKKEQSHFNWILDLNVETNHSAKTGSGPDQNAVIRPDPDPHPC